MLVALFSFIVLYYVTIISTGGLRTLPSILYLSMPQATSQQDDSDLEGRNGRGKSSTSWHYPYRNQRT